MATSQPNPSPGNDGHAQTDSLDSILVIIEGPGDTTVRPGRPNIPLDSYPRPLRPQAPPPAQPPTSGDDRRN
jgi:hypothetical protein